MIEMRMRNELKPKNQRVVYVIYVVEVNRTLKEMSDTNLCESESAQVPEK